MSDLNQYVHDTNMLVDSRISLFVIYPGLRVHGQDFGWSEMSSNASIGDDDPFSGDINFGVFVNEAGGNLFYNRNDIDSEIRRSQQLGSEFHTLSYRPPEGNPDRKFRRIRLTLRDPGLRVITKAGYFAPEEGAPTDPRQEIMVNIAEAVRSTIPFQALDLAIGNLVRHLEMGRVEFLVVLKPRGMVRRSESHGKSAANFMSAAGEPHERWRCFGLKSGNGDRVESHPGFRAASPNPDENTDEIRLSQKTQTLRVVVKTTEMSGSARSNWTAGLWVQRRSAYSGELEFASAGTRKAGRFVETISGTHLGRRP